MTEKIATKENPIIELTPRQIEFICEAGPRLAKMLERSESDFSIVTPISETGEPSGEPYVGYVSEQPAPLVSEDATIIIDGEAHPVISSGDAGTIHLPIPQYED